MTSTFNRRAPRLTLALGTVVALALAIAGGARADSSSYPDPTGDASGVDALDIRKVKAGHAGTRLKHVVTVVDANRFTKRQVFIHVADEFGTNYRVGRTGVYQGATKVGKAKAERRGNRIVLRFCPRTIGSPDTYWWQAFTATFDHPPTDWAPEAGMVRHDLGESS